MEPTIGCKDTVLSGQRSGLQVHTLSAGCLAFYSVPIGETGKSQLRFGAGPTYHINPKLLETGSLAKNTTNFDNALGFVAQVDGIIAFPEWAIGNQCWSALYERELRKPAEFPRSEQRASEFSLAGNSRSACNSEGGEIAWPYPPGD